MRGGLERIYAKGVLRGCEERSCEQVVKMLQEEVTKEVRVLEGGLERSS